MSINSVLNTIPGQRNRRAIRDVYAHVRKEFIIGEVADISTAASSWTISPVDGYITKIWSVIDGAITVADAGLTFELDGTAITGAAITIANASSAAGDVDSSEPTAANLVAAGEAIEIVADGASTDAAKAVILFEITPLD